MSNFVAIDTSSRYLNVIAVKGDIVVQRFIADCALNHSVTLMSEIVSAMEEANLAPSECHFFGAVTGPGSFTGIRIGISTAKGLAFGAGKKQLGVTTFDLLAYNIKSRNFYVVIDAAHSHYYVCGYTDGFITLPPTYMSSNDVLSLKNPLFGFEELPLENYTKISVKDCIYTTFKSKEHLAGDDMYALYVRKSQAEEGRK